MQYDDRRIKAIEQRLNELGSKKLWRVEYEQGVYYVHFDKTFIESFSTIWSIQHIVNEIKLYIQSQIYEEEKYTKELSSKLGKEVKCEYLTKQRYGLS